MPDAYIEEPQPHLLIRALADANPQNRAPQSMPARTKDGTGVRWRHSCSSLQRDG